MLCFNPSSVEWTNPKVSGSLLAPRLGYATTVIEGKNVHKSPPRPDHDPDCHHNLITCSFYSPGPLHEISLQSVHNFLSTGNVANKQTNRPTLLKT